MTTPVPAPILPSLASLLRRLAETADSFAPGSSVYAVAEPVFPHTVHAADTALSAALEAALRSAPSARIYGPLISGQGEGSDGACEPRVQTRMVVTDPDEVWIHDETSEWRKVRVKRPAGLRAAVQSPATCEDAEPDVVVGVASDDLRRQLAALLADASGETRPGLPDAIALTDAAYRKFVQPYLVKVYGVDEALRRERCD